MLSSMKPALCAESKFHARKEHTVQLAQGYRNGLNSLAIIKYIECELGCVAESIVT